MTNPPYSGDHVDRLIFHVVAAKRPFALLVPTYYLGREAWRRAASQLTPDPFYVCPHRRYAYLPPAWARDAAAARTTAPRPPPPPPPPRGDDRRGGYRERSPRRRSPPPRGRRSPSYSYSYSYSYYSDEEEARPGPAP